ncbi:MAG: dihydroorotase [Methylobacteriaceae bacterium]|nr:dihydroorotase [Methylobacteriaceae bacterium]
MNHEPPFASARHPAPVLFARARLVDPASGVEQQGGLLIVDGVIRDLGPALTPAAAPDDARIVDCGGDVLAPGLIDMRAFIGEPGAEHRETIRSATLAAAAGGVTTIVASPATNPPIDDPAVVDFLLRRARDRGLVRVLPSAALTQDRAGREIAEIGLLQRAGAVAFGDGARTIASAQVMRRALTYARDFDALVLAHLGDPELGAEGVMNEGEFASRLGLPGVPREAETIPLDRDLRLVALTGARYHATIVTCAPSLEALRAAKAQGLPVTAGTSINHLTLNENDIGDYRTFLKLSPPLRGEEDRRALVAALAEGLIDVVSSDHDPQDVETKRLPFAECADGAIGLETMLSAGLRLVAAGDVTLPRLLAAMSSRPAEILGLPQGRLARGAPADLIRFDPHEPWIVDPAKLASRCKNTPFDEARMEGRVKLTMVAGRVVHEA